MSRTRPLAGILLLALTTFGLVATGTSPTVANPAFVVSGTAPRAAAHPPLVQGVVVDQFGKFVDDVEVDAVGSPGGKASALTYASKRDDGPQHGYFYLEVGKKGSYTLTLSKDGYESLTIGPVKVPRLRSKVALGEITLTKKPAVTRTSAGLEAGSITPDAHGRVDVSVSTKATTRPVGAVQVREGHAVVGTAALRPADKGSATVVLDRLAAGSHDLKAYFLGSKTLKASASKSMTLTVKKPRHHHRVLPHLG